MSNAFIEENEPIAGKIGDTTAASIEVMRGAVRPLRSACGQTGDQNKQTADEGGDQAGGKQGFSENPPEQCEDRNGERRMIHVAEIKLLTAGDVVPFIPEEARAAEDIDEQMSCGSSEGKDDEKESLR